MRNFLKLAKKRHSAFDFNNREVSEKNLGKILEAGRWAPSSLNVQPWKFIVVKSKKLIRELINVSSYGLFHNDPNVIVVLVLDSLSLKSNFRGVKESKISLTEGLLSIGLPALQMCLEAEDLGISSCLLTPDEVKACSLLNVNARVPLMVGLGYERKGCIRIRSRKDLKDLIFNVGGVK